MKRCIVFTIILLTSLMDLFSQIESNSNYIVFKSYFKQVKNGQPRKIPLEIVTKVIADNNDLINEYVVRIEAYDLLQYKNNTFYIIELMYPAGGYSSSYCILLFSHETFKKSQIIGFNSLNSDGGESCSLKMINDSLLEVKSEKIKYSNVENIEEILNRKYEYYVFNNAGFYKVKSHQFEKARMFPDVTRRVLDETELQKMSKNELDIMRNEIFADHGYIFKTKKWQEYFKKQKWYHPEFNDVNDKLTIIEKVNISKILKVSSLK